MSHACCGEPEAEVDAAPRVAAAPAGVALGAATSTAADALAFAAAPTFALLALWTAFAGDRSMLCMGMPEDSPSNGMALMYALMSAFHATPWLRLISRR